MLDTILLFSASLGMSATEVQGHSQKAFPLGPRDPGFHQGTSSRESSQTLPSASPAVNRRARAWDSFVSDAQCPASSPLHGRCAGERMLNKCLKPGNKAKARRHGKSLPSPSRPPPPCLHVSCLVCTQRPCAILSGSRAKQMCPRISLQKRPKIRGSRG